MPRYLPLFSLLILLLVAVPLPASGFDGEGPGGPGLGQAAKTSGSGPGMWLVSLYRNHISAVDGDRCPSTPSCSAYCARAIKKHGLAVGWMMTVDRLIHEGSEETRVSPVVFSGGKWKIYDPVENNDFWWFSGKREEHD